MHNDINDPSKYFTVKPPITRTRAQFIWEHRSPYGWHSNNPLPEMTLEERATLEKLFSNAPGNWSFADVFYSCLNDREIKQVKTT